MNYLEVFDLLNLDSLGMKKIKEAIDTQKFENALNLLKVHFSNRKTPCLFIEEEKDEIVEYTKANYKDDIKEILNVAEEVCNKEFVFRFRWDMERTNVPVKFDEEIKWDTVPFNDPEWAWMLNRHRYWIALGQAYWLTGDEKYAKVFCEQLEHWIDSNPIDCPGKFYTWRTIECGIRCENWLKSYEYFKNSKHLTNELFAKFLISLHEHCEYIYNSYDSFRKTSNWGVLENHGLFEVSTYISEFKNSKLWQEQSILRLNRAAKLQVMKDGIHWEQSPMYHNEVLHCFMDNLVLANKNGINLGIAVTDTVKKMSYADLYYAKPNHKQAMKGDSDNTDVRDIITTAALILKDGTLKFGGYEAIDFENLFTFGMSSIEQYNNITPLMPKHTSYAFEDSGNYVMRSGWKENDLYLNFHCGKVGAGHDHADTFNIDICAYGNDLITDSGRYTYVAGEWREYFKECKAHNTTLVDGKNFTEWKGSWGITHAADTFAQRFISEDDFDYVEGGHKGYSILEDPVYPFRKILFVKSCNNPYWVLIDTFETRGSHSYSQYFHFAPGEVFIQKGTNIGYSCFEKGGNLSIIPADEKKVEAKLLDTYISFEYNLKEKNKSIEYIHTAKGFTSIINVLYPQKEGDCVHPQVRKVDVYNNDGEIVNNNVAEAIKVIFKNNEEHIILITHNAPSSHKNFYTVEDTLMYGEVVLIKRSINQEEVINIK